MILTASGRNRGRSISTNCPQRSCTFFIALIIVLIMGDGLKASWWGSSVCWRSGRRVIVRIRVEWVVIVCHVEVVFDYGSRM